LHLPVGRSFSHILNDSDLRLEMKKLPLVLGTPSDAVFAVVRSELGDFIRHAKFHLDFTTPALNPVVDRVQARFSSESNKLAVLESTIEGKYLKFCDPDNPLHFMTIWMSRAYLARCRLMDYYSRCFSSSAHLSEIERDSAIVYALDMLHDDTKLMSSPLTKGYRWIAQINFPFLAYIHIVQDMRKRPANRQVQVSWDAMNDNYETRFEFLTIGDAPFFALFSKIVLQAWDACEGALKQSGETLLPPRIVASIKDRISQGATGAHNTSNIGREQPNTVMADEFSMLMPLDIGSLMCGMGATDDYMQRANPLDMLGQSRYFSTTQLDWATTHWNLGNVTGW